MTDTATLAARSAELYYTYARAVDEEDLDTLRSIVTDDVLITRGDNPTHNALNVPVCKHVVTNVLAEPDGDEIKTHAYFQATFLEEARTRVIIGVYDDVHVERDGKLKLAHKKIRVQRVLELPASTGLYAHVGKE
jgi:3-phenylpropionate/cinnamic acid dioxygenase small subunit